MKEETPTRKRPPLSTSAAKPALPVLDRAIYLGVAVLLGGLCGVLSLDLSCLTEEANALSWELRVQELLFLISVPDEALFCDDEAHMEVAAARIRAYQRHGAKSFVPFAQKLHPGERLTFTADGVPVDDLPTTDFEVVVKNSLEQSWSADVFKTLMFLAAEAELEEGVGGYLRENPEVFRARVKEPLERLLSAYEPRTRLSGSMALLAFGERGSLVQSVVVQLTELGGDVGETAKEMRLRHGF